MNNSATDERILIKFDIRVFFSQYLVKIPVSLKSDKNNGYFTLRPMYKVVQIWPGRFVCKQVTVCPGHIWTTLYIYDNSLNCF